MPGFVSTPTRLAGDGGSLYRWATCEWPTQTHVVMRQCPVFTLVVSHSNSGIIISVHIISMLFCFRHSYRIWECEYCVGDMVEGSSFHIQKSKGFCMLVDIPSEKLDSCSLTYSLNVCLCHLPNF